MNEDVIKAKLGAYKFYHVIKLTESIYTPGNPRYLPVQRLVLEALKKIDLKDKRVLDIGCRDGLFSFEAERMGSSEVIGIDNDLSKPAIEFLIPYFKSSVKMYEMNLFDLKADTFGLFDVVIFPGVLYHLRYPFWAFKIIRNILRDEGELIVETAIWDGDKHHSMLYCPTGLESPYSEPTSCTFFNEKGFKDSLYSLGIHVKYMQYLHHKEISIRNVMRNVKLMSYEFYLKLRGINKKTNIDRAVFICTVSNERQSEFQGELISDYWDGLHNIHTRLGG